MAQPARWRVEPVMTASVILLFVLGVANFALHRAVLESGHPLIRQTPWLQSRAGVRISLGAEFVVLLGAMLMAGAGVALAWCYVAYSLFNGFSGWLILSRRI